MGGSFMRTSFCCVGLILAAAFVSTLTAQVAGRLTGSVTDPTGAVVPNATVSLLLADGTKPLFTTTTTSDGLFHFAVRPETYDVTVEAPGFLKYKMTKVKIETARETDIPTIKLEIASVNQTLEVVAGAQSVEVSSAEVSTTITNEQIRKLPVLDRDPLALINTQAGVNFNVGDTVINGERSSYSAVTLDGINIQDNFIRTGGLDFIPNLVLADQIGEFTLSTSNSNSTLGGGSSQVSFITPSGTNTLHGDVLWYNRNNFFAANTFFNNQQGLPRPFLNQNQIGGSAGGPIIKDKLFFYAH